ncbi:hypothetical protein, partial [Paenibacillus ihuae]|uniref:hypothetical protein n=1 Tax=Paenibacillus ihuae TaxID=1232431 RepID=UPI00131CF3E0
MNDEFLQARELFVRYSGSLVQMHREGALKTYQEYNIPKETEQQWLQELTGDYLQRLSIRDWEAVAGLETLSKQYQDPEIVE